MIAFFLTRNSGSGCQPRPSKGAYFTIFKVNCRTLVSRRPDLSRKNFALNSLIRSINIRRDSILRFANADIVLSHLNMRVGAALRYCSKHCLFAIGLTGSYSTWIVINTLAAPPNSISCLWMSRPQSSLVPESAWSRSNAALNRWRYLICRKFITRTPIG